MKSSVTSSDPGDLEELRTLLINSAEKLAGPGAFILKPGLPGDGSPILMHNAEHQPVVISFDPGNGETALINGLRAVERLTATRPEPQPARLVVVSQTLLPASTTILANCSRLQLYVVRRQEINDTTRLWLDRVQTDTPDESAAEQPLPEDRPTLAKSSIDADSLPALSEEEASYFRQL